MFKNPMHRIIWWSVFTLIADFFAIWGLYRGQAAGPPMLAASMMSFALMFMIVCYRIDGPNGVQLNRSDERIGQIADRSCSIGFDVLFIGIWFLAFLINTPGLTWLRQHLELALASVALIGLLAHLFSFVWFKLHVT